LIRRLTFFLKLHPVPGYDISTTGIRLLNSSKEQFSFQFLLCWFALVCPSRSFLEAITYKELAGSEAFLQPKRCIIRTSGYSAPAECLYSNILGVSSCIFSPCIGWIHVQMKLLPGSVSQLYTVSDNQVQPGSADREQ
jgi:hypothetical protein